jgi:predicted choloylglycine hydrolase
LKSRLGLSGDVYLYNNHFIENLESHKKLILNSKAKDINEAFVERVQYEVEQEKLQAEQAKENQREIEELQ